MFRNLNAYLIACNRLIKIKPINQNYFLIVSVFSLGEAFFLPTLHSCKFIKCSSTAGYQQLVPSPPFFEEEEETPADSSLSCKTCFSIDYQQNQWHNLDPCWQKSIGL